MIPACTADYRVLARRRLPKILFDYVDGGSYGEVTLRHNIDDFESVQLRQRVLRDVSSISTSIELFGQHLAMPVVLAPIGLAGMLARRGEVEAARAAAAAGVPFSLSTVGICGIEEVAAASSAPIWFQLYMIRDRAVMADLISQAAVRASVLVLTVDLPSPGARYRDVRSGMFGGLGPVGRLAQAMDGLAHPTWIWNVYIGGRPHSLGNLSNTIPDARGLAAFWTWVRANFDPSVTWADLDWVRARWAGPIILKGILDADDARSAIAAGVDGIVVSNHGGRQLDSAPSSIKALPAIVDAVQRRIPVLMDGGVCSGLDVLKAIALGADACLIGRAWAYALAAGGEPAVRHLLSLIESELRTAMMLTGCCLIGEVAEQSIVVRGSMVPAGSARLE